MKELALIDYELRRLAVGGCKRIILLTNGHSNEGCDPEVVARVIKKKGIQLDIIGIGGSPDAADEPTLKRMAEMYHDRRRIWCSALRHSPSWR